MSKAERSPSAAALPKLPTEVLDDGRSQTREADVSGALGSKPWPVSFTRREGVGLLAAFAVLLTLIGVWVCNNRRDAERMDVAVSYACTAYAEAARAQSGSVSFGAPDVVGLDPVELSNRIDTECAAAKEAWRENTQQDTVSRSSGSDTSELSTELENAGVSSSDLDRLAAIGRDTGYLPANAGASIIESFVYMAVLECRDVANGTITWENSIARAVTSGAARADARRFVGFLQASFCPGVR